MAKSKKNKHDDEKRSEEELEEEDELEGDGEYDEDEDEYDEYDEDEDEYDEDGDEYEDEDEDEGDDAHEGAAAFGMVDEPEDPYWWTPHLALSLILIVSLLGFFGLFNAWLGFLAPHHDGGHEGHGSDCLLYTSPSPRDQRGSRMPSSA